MKLLLIQTMDKDMEEDSPLVNLLMLLHIYNMRRIAESIYNETMNKDDEKVVMHTNKTYHTDMTIMEYQSILDSLFQVYLVDIVDNAVESYHDGTNIPDGKDDFKELFEDKFKWFSNAHDFEKIGRTEFMTRMVQMTTAINNMPRDEISSTMDLDKNFIKTGLISDMTAFEYNTRTAINKIIYSDLIDFQMKLFTAPERLDNSDINKLDLLVQGNLSPMVIIQLTERIVDSIIEHLSEEYNMDIDLMTKVSNSMAYMYLDSILKHICSVK